MKIIDYIPSNSTVKMPPQLNLTGTDFKQRYSFVSGANQVSDDDYKIFSKWPNFKQFEQRGVLTVGSTRDKFPKTLAGMPQHKQREIVFSCSDEETLRDWLDKEDRPVPALCAERMSLLGVKVKALADVS